MITERQYIKDNLYDFFEELLQEEGITGIPIIWGNDNGPRPDAPFLMLEFRSTSNPGMPDFGDVQIEEGGTEVQRVTQYTRRNMTMYGFGERAIDVLETIKSQLNISDWIDKLRSRNLVIPQVFETLETPQSFETVRENGASFDFDLTYLRVLENSPGYIDGFGLKPDFGIG